jgi:hypothetical protein
MPSTAGSAVGLPAPSRPPWWMLALAAAFAGYFALLIHSDLTRPEPPGFISEAHGVAMMLAAVAPDSPASRAGLQAGDRILTANGLPISNRLDWLVSETNLQTGRPLVLEAARGSERLTAVLVLSRVPAGFWATSAGITLLAARAVQLVTLVLAFVVILKKPFDPSARAGGWLLGTLAVYSIVLPYQIAATWRALPAVAGAVLWVPFASSVAVAGVLFTFFAIFPRPVFTSPWAWVAVWAPILPVSWLQIQFTARAVYHPERAVGFVDWTAAITILTVAYAAAALGVLVVGYRHLTDVTERRRVGILVLGSMVGLVSLLAVVGMYWGRPGAMLRYSVFASPVAAAGAIVGLAVPISFAYAILRHRLFGISYIVRRGLQYALARRVLVSVVPAVTGIFLADLWIHRAAPVADIVRARGWVYVALAGLAVVARMERQGWLDALDRRFFRERYGAERLLRGISDEVRAAASFNSAAPRFVAEIEAALHPEFAALLVRRPGEPFYEVVTVNPPGAGPGPIPMEHRVIGLLEWLQKPLQVPAADRAGLLRQLSADDLDWLRRSNVELVVPLRSMNRGAVEGLIVLGAKRSEEPYSVQDEDLLTAIGDSLGGLVARQAPQTVDLLEECPRCGACYSFGTGRCVHDGSTLTPSALPPLLGGRYRLERRVGRGGMGTVYAARDTALGRRVAAKVLRDDLPGGAHAAERFQSEAQLAAALAHPNVVIVHDIGVTPSGRGFFIMELLEGVTLRQELRRVGRLPPARVLHIMRGVCAAVDTAHAQQLIHRDLKPENIFLCRSEIPKVMDFGLAKALEVSSMLTEPGLVAGTPQYMAPEHVRGGEASPDWDLWALAVMAFEMIVGELPFDSLPSRELRVNDLPAAQQALFSRALAPDPLDRPTSAREFLDDLDRVLTCNELQP